MTQEVKLTLNEKLKFLEPFGWFINADHLTNSLTGCTMTINTDFFEGFVDELYSHFSEPKEPKETLSTEELLAKNNWDLICESPMEIECQISGKIAKGEAANYIIFELREQNKCS